MIDLTPDQVDILSEIEETIEKLTLIASRVEQGKPIGGLLTIKSNRLNYLLGRYQMFIETQPNQETEEEWLKRIGTENTRQIAKAFKDVTKAFSNISPESRLPLQSQKYNLETRLDNGNLEDDRISVDTLANLSASDALKLKPKQYKQWIAVQRERYKSQHDNY